MLANQMPDSKTPAPKHQHIAFLHTSPVHVEPFERLVRAVDSTLQVDHVVAEDLLADARRLGLNDPGLIQRVHSTILKAGSTGASLVVCTCSTIGSLAERAPTEGQFGTVRIDRAMADQAVKRGPNILLVAALESTIDPTTRLIQESAMTVGAPINIRTLWVADAWQHFEKNDHHRYLLAIARAVELELMARDTGEVNLVVLAQASMAPADKLLEHLGVEVLSSPKLGIQAIIDYLKIL